MAECEDGGGHRPACAHRNWPYVVATLLAAIGGGLFLASPGGIGRLALVTIAAGGIIAMVFGPLVRHAEPRRAWRFLALAGLFFAVSLYLRLDVSSERIVLAGPGVCDFAGYLATALAFSHLLAAVSGHSGRMAAIDAAIVTFGTLLATWSSDLGPLLGPHTVDSTDAQRIVENVLAITCDALLICLAAHVIYRAGRRCLSMTAFLVALTGAAVTDVGYLVLRHLHLPALSYVPDLGALVTYTAIGIAATHPSVVDIVTVVGDSRGRVPTSRQSMMLVALVLPAALALSFPSTGVIDIVVRVALLTLSLFMVALRMVTGDAALAETERRALHQAKHDALTGLPNRAAFAVRVEEMLRCPALGDGLSLFLLDSDRFKQINDTWGHDVGDMFLQSLTRRLREVQQDTGALYRLGGDEFVLVVPGSSETAASLIAERILKITRRPLPLPTGQVITATTSIGVAQARPGDQVSATDLIRDADIALYTAKDRGRATWALFDASLREVVTRRVRLAAELREAVTSGSIIPHYQPIRGGPGFRRLAGFEALARWQRADGVSVTPNQFIPVAEDTGLIIDLGESMLRRACADLVRWRHDSGADLHVSVNVSAEQMSRGDVPSLVEDTLRELALTPSALWLEITESVLMHDRTTALAALGELASMGVTMCIDDFGTGYSSLSYLKDYPVHVVKVDRAFVSGLPVCDRSAAMTRAIVDLVSVLGFRGTVAEGVENADQATALEAIGCIWGQGFLWGRALPASDVSRLVTVPSPATIA